MSTTPRKKKRKTNKQRYIALAIFAVITTAVLIYAFYPRLNLTLKEGESITVPFGEEFRDPGYIASYGDSDCEKVTVQGTVDTSKLGTYTLTYKAVHNGKSKTATRKVTVADLTGPIITAPDVAEIYSGYPLSEIHIDYSAVDYFDGDCTATVKRVDYPDSILLTATDKKGNSSSKRIQVNFIADTVSPIITINGPRCMILNKGESYTDKGATASDDRDGDLTALIKVSGAVDTNTLGTYKLNYTVTDKGGNTATETRYIIISDSSAQTDPGNKVIYLTFDDGPSPNTPYVLDILKEYGIKATFFVTAQHTESLPYIARIFNEGHTVAAHTYSHKWEIYKNKESYFEDLDKINSVIAQYTGSPSRLIRFPGGSSNRVSANHKVGVMSEIVGECYQKGYVYFDWNIDSMDTSTSDPNKIAKNVTSRLGNGYYNVLMHDTKVAHRQSLPIIIEYALENGYTFLPLTETSPAVHHSIKN